MPDSQKRHASKRRRQERVRRAERKVEGSVQWLDNKLFRPEVASGLFAVVNLGVLGIVGYQVYSRPSLVTEPRVNVRPLAVIFGGLIGLFVLEGWATNAYLNTPQVRPQYPCGRDFDSIQGQDELRYAEHKGHYLFNRVREVVLRTQVSGDLHGAGMSTT